MSYRHTPHLEWTIFRVSADSWTTDFMTPLHDRHVRVPALIAAIAIVGGAALSVEWLARTDRPDAATPPSADVMPPAPAPGTAPAPARPMVTPPPQIEAAARRNTIFKCKVGDRTVYADAPCGEHAEAIALPPPSAGLSPDRSYAEQLVRVRAERARHAALQPAPAEDIARRPVTRNRCASIDASVMGIDAATRQPHDVPAAEHFRARRKALMDERFTLGCNG